MVARITGVLNQIEIAETVAGTVLLSPSASPFPVLLVNSGLALLAVVQHDAVAARKQYAVLESERGTMLPPSVSLAADHLLGLLSVTIGRLEDAITHFEGAVTFCRKAGYRPELAWTCYDYAVALVQHNDPFDQEKAMSLLHEARFISKGLSMRPLMERVAACLDGLAEGAPPAPAYPDGLTQREVEVLRLIAQGRNNPEIAQELVVSIRTVTTHVSNIFSKVKAANRAAAATYAIRHGLV
jgi:DNA-binding CsgD family transcriptional regulator